MAEKSNKSKVPMKQLDLFTFVIDDDNFSHTIELYDAVPKFVRKKRVNIKNEHKDELIGPITREFSFRGKMFQVTIAPWYIYNKKENGHTEITEIFPGEREELVQDALIKLATDNLHGCNLDGMASVKFSMSELYNELRRRGHEFHKDEIIEAITICNKTSVEIKSGDGNVTYTSSPIFFNMGIARRDDWRASKENCLCYVQFHPLVTNSIRNNTFRQYNYVTYMSYRRSLSRYLHKRMAHHFIQASYDTEYKIQLNSLLRDSGSHIYPSLSHNIREVTKALDEMAEKDVVLRYDIRKKKDGRRIVDADIIIKTKPKFNQEVKRANAERKKLKQDNRLKQF